MCRYVTGLSAREEDTERLAQRIYDEQVKQRVYPDALSTIKQLKYDGYKIVLITQSPGFLAKPLGRVLGVSRVISNVLEVDAEQAFTGKLAGDCMTAEGKREKVLAFAKEVGVDMKKSIAYGRSGVTDMPLLECVGKAYAVSPDTQLRTKAAVEGWQVLGWAADGSAGEPAAVVSPQQQQRNVGGSLSSARTPSYLPPSPASPVSPASPAPSFAYAAFATTAGPAPTAAATQKSNPWMMRDPDQYDDENNRSRAR